MTTAAADTVPPIQPEHIAALNGLERIWVSCKTYNGLQELWFEYTPWPIYRQQCFRELARRTRRPRVPKQLRKDKQRQLHKVAGAFVGSMKAYDIRTRKVCYAKMITLLRESLPGIETQRAELIAGTALSHCSRNRRRVCGGVDFNPLWDMETLREFIAFRWHHLPAGEIHNLADLNRHVSRHLDILPLSCRRKVKRYVLQRRHYCMDYDHPDLLKAIDCSFKYTGSAYAFEKARTVGLAQLVPEVFFKKAGQKIRVRQYARWLRESRDHFRDIGSSLWHLTDPSGPFNSWADLERHSREWHAQQIARARRRFQERQFIDRAPFNIPPQIPRSIDFQGYAFAFLTSHEQMAEETLRMQHCIHSYADRVRKGRYLAYKVEGNGERATLGLEKDDDAWTFDQARGYRNASVSEKLTAACKEFADLLNREAEASEQEKGGMDWWDQLAKGA